MAREFSDDPVAGPSADPADVDAGQVAPGLSDFLERVALVADADQIPDAPDDDDGGVVTLMTLHTAKGLEFPVVFLTGLEDGVFPHSRSLGDQPELEEERRLAYVGVTRAQQRLYVSRAVIRSAWGAPAHNPASRFLDELPVDLVDWRRTEAAQTRWGRPDLAAGSAARLGTPTEAGRRNFSSAALRADAAAKSKPAREIPSLEPGDRVVHDSFGLGTVVALEGVADKTVASIDFGVRGRQAAAAALRPGREALSDRHRPTAGGQDQRRQVDAVHEERLARVDGVAAAGVHLDVEVRAGHVAGGADGADLLAGGDRLAGGDQERRSGGSTRSRCRHRA